MRSGDFLPAPVFEPRINDFILFSSSFSLNNTLFDVFSGLRVPQVHVSIVPDQMLPGDLASPFVTETSLLNPDTGVEELVHFVRIRESEAESSTITFDVPVYAVNDTGNLVPANGIFNARIPNLPTGVNIDCNDCVMVDGEATLTITLDAFGTTPPQFDLTTIEVFGGMEDCSATTDTSATNDAIEARMTGCARITASHEVPNAALDLEDFNVTLPADFFSARVNTVSFGNTQEERNAFLVNFRDTSVDVVKLGINFIPFISDGADLLTQLYNQAVGNDVDPVLATLASAGLILDATTGGVGDVTAGIKGLYKMSRSFDGFFAVAIRNSVDELITGGKNAIQLITELGEQVGSVARLFFEGGFAAIRSADNLAKQLSDLPICPLSLTTLSTQASGCEATDIVRAVNEALTLATSRGVRKTDFLALASAAENRVGKVQLEAYVDWLADRQLRNVGNNTFVSAEGLKYTSIGKKQHRIAHVLEHLDEAAAGTQVAHGVSNANENIFDIIDEAWSLKKVGNIQPDPNDPSAFNITMPRVIGYSGGGVGTGNDTNLIRIVR